MPSPLVLPVLHVDTHIIHKVDTSDPKNLHYIWTVFAKCADSVAQGRRLENLSWRLWTRETFCCDEERVSTSATVPAKPVVVPRRSSSLDDIPQLSGSVDSLDEEAVEFTSESAPVDIARPRILREDSYVGSRGRGRERLGHISSDNLEKMVLSILDAETPLTAPLPDISASFPAPPKEKPTKPAALAPAAPVLERSGSTTDEDVPRHSSQNSSPDSLQQQTPPEVVRRTTVIRGFTPSPSSFKRIPSQTMASTSLTVIPEPLAAPAPKIIQPKKQPAKFALGGSSGEDSYSDRGASLENRKLAVPPQPKRKMFQVGGSSDDDGSLKSALVNAQASNARLSAQKKQASFSAQLVTRTIPSTSAVEDDQSETDYVDESAIDDDDDSSDWEDSVDDGGKPSADEKVTFKRVDSKPNLVSRPSLLSMMLTQNDRAQRLSNNASQSTSALPRPRAALRGPSLVASPNDSDESPLMMKRGARAPPMRSINEVQRSAAQPIMTTTNGIQHQAALSPRTTRRNMLSTELTESLRRHLLWERSQKTSTANAVLKRRHTSQDIANLKQYPERPYLKKSEDINSSSWNQDFAREAMVGYHTQGW